MPSSRLKKDEAGRTAQGLQGPYIVLCASLTLCFIGVFDISLDSVGKALFEKKVERQLDLPCLMKSTAFCGSGKKGWDMTPIKLPKARWVKHPNDHPLLHLPLYISPRRSHDLQAEVASRFGADEGIPLWRAVLVEMGSGSLSPRDAVTLYGAWTAADVDWEERAERCGPTNLAFHLPCAANPVYCAHWVLARTASKLTEATMNGLDRALEPLKPEARLPSEVRVLFSQAAADFAVLKKATARLADDNNTPKSLPSSAQSVGLLGAWEDRGCLGAGVLKDTAEAERTAQAELRRVW
jgi:hypothetical protein